MSRLFDLDDLIFDLLARRDGDINCVACLVSQQCFAHRGLVGDGGHIVARLHRADDAVGHFIAKFHVADGDKAAQRSDAGAGSGFLYNLNILQLVFQCQNARLNDCLFVLCLVVLAVFGKVAKTACNADFFQKFLRGGSFSALPAP